MAGMETDGLPIPRRYWSILAIMLALTMAQLDASIANVALPTLARELHTTPAASVWVVNAYQLAIVASLLPLASLGEIFGYRRVYQAGLALFTLASVGCALSPNLGVLTFARVVQGLGAAGIMSMIGALVRYTYPHRLLGRAIGFNALILALSSAAGPPLASAILAVTSWHWLFAINGPLGLVALAIGLWAVPNPEPAPRRFDVWSAILNALAFGPLVLGAETLARDGDPLVGGLAVAVGVAAGATLVRRSLSQTHPLFPFDLLRIRILALSIGTSFTAFVAQTLAIVSLPFMLQYFLGRSVVETGLLMTPWLLATAVAAPLAGRIADGPGGPALGSVGLVAFAVGMVLLAWLTPHASALDIGWRMAVCGVGFGMFQSPNNRAILGSAPRARVGSAGGLLATARLAGQTTGATLTAFLFHLSPAGRNAGTPLLIGAAFALAAAAVSVFKLREGGPPPAAAGPEAMDL
ncbi:MAG TPA: MFS transporter [Caulobacteraceae bacterium]|jgi:DHA2 family multidrug resistance protein-like MFS transporter|nr:MFS transporter [Caulobacteraceae bacterium]